MSDTYAIVHDSRVEIGDDEPCAWLAGCDQPPAYLAHYSPCDAPRCSKDTCVGALVCEKHAAMERADNPTLTHMTSVVRAATA